MSLRLSSFALVVLLVWPVSAFAEGGKVTITPKAPPVKTKITETRDNTISLNLDIRADNKTQSNAIAEETHEVRLTEVLGAQKEVVTKIKVHYKSVVEKRTENGVPGVGQDRQALVGKTYLVESKNNVITVVSDQGKPVSAVESDLVKKDYSSLGKRDPMTALVTKKPLAVGEEFPVTQELAQELFKGEKNILDLQLTKATMKLQEVKKQDGRQVAVFRIFMDMKAAQDFFTMTFKLEGNLTVTVDGAWPLDLSLKGPITMGADTGSPVAITGKGSMTFGATAKY